MKTKIATAIVAAAILAGTANAGTLDKESEIAKEGISIAASLTGTAQKGDITTVDLKSEVKKELQNVYVEAKAGKINGKADFMVSVGKWGFTSLNTPYIDPFIYNFSVSFSANKQFDSSASAMFTIEKDLGVYIGAGAESILADKTIVTSTGVDNVGNDITYSTKETSINNLYADVGVVYNVMTDVTLKYGVAVGTDKTELTAGALYMITENDYVKVNVGKSILESGYKDPDLNVNVTLGYAF